jgi:hypothetical protein
MARTLLLLMCVPERTGIERHLEDIVWDSLVDLSSRQKLLGLTKRKLELSEMTVTCDLDAVRSDLVMRFYGIFRSKELRLNYAVSLPAQVAPRKIPLRLGDESWKG